MTEENLFVYVELFPVNQYVALRFSVKKKKKMSQKRQKKPKKTERINV